MIARGFFCFLLLFLYCQASRTQFNCLFEHYSTEDGLSHGSVVNMMKDSRGFLWVLTWDGLNRFDGYTFKTYKSRPGDNVGLSSNRFNSIVEDHYGFLWLQSYDWKVYRFNRNTEQFENIIRNEYYNHKEIKFETIFKSSSGDIWVTTQNAGLFRIIPRPVDFKCEITHYTDSAGNYSISGNEIKHIYEDSNQNIWIVTNNGMDCLKQEKSGLPYFRIKFKENEDLIFKKYHFKVFYEQHQYLWTGTTEGNLIKIDTRNFGTDDVGFGNNKAISAIAGLNDTILIIGTNGNGAFRFNCLKNKIVNQSVNPKIRNVHKLYIDRQKNIWFETSNPGIIKTSSDINTLKHFNQQTDVAPTLQIRTTNAFYEDDKGTLWMIMKYGGFGYYNSEKDEVDYFYNKPGSADRKMSNYVICFYKDSSDVMWLSTYFKGIEKITFLENKFTLHVPQPGSINRAANEVRSLFEDNKGILWAGTKEGRIYLFDNNYQVVKHYYGETGTGSGLVYSFLQDKNGVIWLGTKGNGLFKAIEKDKTGRNYSFVGFQNNPDNVYSLSNDQVYSVFQDSKGRIWIGTYGGGLNLLTEKNGQILFKHSGNSFRNYPIEKGSRIRQINEDVKGNIWIATTDGLIIFNPNERKPEDYRFYHYFKIPGNKNSLGNNDIHCIFRDSHDTIWIGTQGGGLHKLFSYPDAGTPPLFTIFTREDGLPSDVIMSIEEDKRGNLWFSTENGIVKYDRSNGVFISYDEHDGLKRTSLSEAASFTKISGEMVFGSYDGFYSFYPDSIVQHKKKVNLEFTAFHLFNKEVKPGDKDSPLTKAISEVDEIRLKHYQSMFSIEYTGLDQSVQHKINYAYRMDGLDDPDAGWHSVKKQRLATYTNIKPGNYLFRVKIENPEFQVGNFERTLRIIVEPPLWRTSYAYGFYLFILLLLILLTIRIIRTIIKLRNKVIIEKEISDLKLRFFTNISHELRTPLTLITGPAEEIALNEKLSETGKEHLRLIETNAKRMLRHINQLLDFRKIQNKKMVLKLSASDLVLFVSDICGHFKALAAEKNIDFSFSSEVKSLMAWIDEEKLDTVIFNLLSNAFKFTPSGKKIKVLLKADNENQTCIIEVSDEGIGIPEDRKPFIFQRFAEIHVHDPVRNIGTGIGLALSKELIDLHKGEISFKSEEGIGTTFRVVLKTGKEHFKPDEAKVIENERDFHKEQIFTQESETDLLTSSFVMADTDAPLILIVEDNVDLRKYISGILQSVYKIEEAANGTEGLEKAENLNPDLIISDIMMPEMDGMELVSKLRSNFETSHIPVILLTAKSSIESKLDGLKYGADDYITKPFNSIYLKARIANLLEQRKNLFRKYSETLKITDIAPTELVVTDRDGEFLKKVVRIIEDNISKPDFRIEQIARTIGMGRTNFFKKLKGLTAMPPVDFVKELRLRRAMQLLETGQYTVSEVSFMCGFSDAGYFSKCFKERFNEPPSSFIKSKK